MLERTLAMIKPDAVAAGYAPAIRERIVREGFVVLREQERRLSRAEAEAFYQEHTNEPWFDEIIAFMCSGPLIVLVLEREDAISAWRKLLGHRWPPVARDLDPSCLRALYGTDGCGTNAVHGADSVASVRRELALFGWADLIEGVSL